MDPVWKKSIWFSILRSEPKGPIELRIVMGAVGYQLMILGADRVMLACGGAGGVLGKYQIKELTDAIAEGVAKLEELQSKPVSPSE